tara:strand:- start:15312 stop:15878 length:567 start_codon:yes stop_codon:yes gene_type:complete
MADTKDPLQTYLGSILDEVNQEKLRRLLHETFYLKDDERMLLKRPDSDDYKEYPIIVLQGKYYSGKTVLKDLITDAFARDTPNDLVVYFIESRVDKKGNFNELYAIHDKNTITDLLKTTKRNIEKITVATNTVLLIESNFSVMKTYVNAQIVKVDLTVKPRDINTRELRQPFVDWVKSYEAPMTKHSN